MIQLLKARSRVCWDRRGYRIRYEQVDLIIVVGGCGMSGRSLSPVGDAVDELSSSIA